LFKTREKNKYARASHFYSKKKYATVSLVPKKFNFMLSPNFSSMKEFVETLKEHPRAPLFVLPVIRRYKSFHCQGNTVILSNK